MRDAIPNAIHFFVRLHIKHSICTVYQSVLQAPRVLNTTPDSSVRRLNSNRRRGFLSSAALGIFGRRGILAERRLDNKVDRQSYRFGKPPEILRVAATN